MINQLILISADVILKMTTILKELRIAQLCSKNERTLDDDLTLIFLDRSEVCSFKTRKIQG